MSSNKKNKCFCKKCGTRFRSKNKFADLCPEHNIKQLTKKDESN